MNTFVLVTALMLSIAQNRSGFETARDLYAAAAFEEALASLDRIDNAALQTATEERLVDEYRIFTLYALRRGADAEAAAASLVRRDPSTALQSEDASPRIRAMFDSVRARVLPQLITERYEAGRAALERKEFAAAERELTGAARALDAAAAAKIAGSGLADLRVLVDGFLLLSKSQPASASTVAEVAVAKGANASAPAGTAAAKSIYGVHDIDVVPPVALQQRLPEVPATLHQPLVHSSKTLVVNLTIDETGKVRRAQITTPVNPVYDRMVTDAASRWRYKPATRRGVAVSYLKVLSVTVQ